MNKLTLALYLYRALVLLFALTGNPLSDRDKTDLHDILTGNIASLCQILTDCEREGLFEAKS